MLSPLAHPVGGWVLGGRVGAGGAQSHHQLLSIPQVWAEMADGSCRWRQTGGEVKVLALRVPADLPSKQLRVDIQPYSVKGGCC